MQFIDLSAQYKEISERVDTRIKRVLEHGKYIMGPEVKELEERLADYVGVKHCISCANGTDALSLSLMALNVGSGDAVFCPTFTFFATAESIALAKATPVFVDSDEDTFNICSASLEKQIIRVIDEGKLAPRAIIAVDLFGLPANYPELEILAKKYDLKLIEDAAQGFGGAIGEKRAGGFGDIATTSFFPAKPLGCYGDGGAVFTDDDNLAELVNSYRVHGKGVDKYDNVRIGVNSRLDTMQAAILLEKLSIFPQELVARNELAASYSKNLHQNFLVPSIPEGYFSSWAQYTIISPQRDDMMGKVLSKGIPSAVYYRTCMHEQTAFSYLNVEYGQFPVAEKLSKQAFSLPMHPYMRPSDIDSVVASLC